MENTAPAPEEDVQRTVPPDAPVGCPGTESASAGKSASCAGCPNQSACASGTAAGVDPDLAVIQMRIGASIQHKLLVLSGKGGVGKSTFAAQLAYALAAETVPNRDSQNDVGLLDIDICGPSAPKLFGLEGAEVRQSNTGWQPIYVEDNLAVMSIGFMLPSKEDAIIWRGARKTGLIKQFVKDVDWGLLDYLIVDSPPGTSDEHISLVQFLKNCDVDGAIIVTTPQEVSLLDVRKEINFCKKSGTKVVGVVENMAGFVCPHCAHCTEIFSPTTGGAAKMCEEMGVRFLGRIPLDPVLAESSELGKSAFLHRPDSPGVKAFYSVIENIKQAIAVNKESAM